MRIQMDSVLWDFAKNYRKLWLRNNPGGDMSLGLAAIVMLYAMEKTGDVSRLDHGNGGATWKATAKFIRATNLEPGPLVVLGPDVH
jgi:hypothetical protein